jgi:signal transduction histidine kinase
MAREIHDTIAQGLTGIVTQLEAAQQTTHDAERERRIDNAKRLARDSLAEARRSVQALRPQALENSRLPEALADEVARWSVTSGVAGEVETTGEARALHPEVEVTLLRVAQEALANVAKHASASRAGVTLLSQRELDILELIAQGCSNREAAARLFISEATVKTHVLHIYAKLGVNDRAAAVAAGFERRLLPRS